MWPFISLPSLLEHRVQRFVIDSYVQTYMLNIQGYFKGRDCHYTNNFTSVLSSCQVLALGMTCPYLICDFSPLVWTCYQLDQARSFILGVPHHRHSQASPHSWQDLGWCVIPPSLHALSSHQQKVTHCWLLVAQNHSTAPLASQGPSLGRASW